MKNGKYKWFVLALISVSYFLAQGTRFIYASILPQLKIDFAHLGISDTVFGMVGGCFTLVFGLMMPFAGLAADLLHRKRSLIIGMVAFGAGVFLSGFAQGLGMLFISYGIINALGQSLLPPCNTSYISQYHTETRGTAFAIYQSAIYIGVVVCSVASGWFSGLGEGGWRKAFWIFGAIVLVWGIVMAIFLKDSRPGCKTDSKPGIREALRAFSGKKTAWLLMGALGCYFFVTYAFKLWAPLFIQDKFPDMSSVQVVFHATFWFYAGALAGVTLGGRLSDKLRKVRNTIRIDIELVGLLLCIPFILTMAYSQNPALLFASLLLFGFATGIYDSNLYAALFEVVDSKYRAVATGIFGCGGCVVGAAGQTIVGWMSSVNSLSSSMAFLALVAALGCLFIFIATRFTLKKDLICLT